MKKPLLLLLLASLFLNAYFLSTRTSTSGKDDVVARVGGQELKATDLSGAVAREVLRLQRERDALLRKEAEEWVASIVLPKEAAARKMSVSELLAREVHQKVKIGPDEVYKRYVQTPAADAMPLTDAMKKIEDAMQQEELEAAKGRLLRTLFKEYDVRIAVPPAASGPASFPPYRRPASGPELSKDGRVISPPIRGAAGAPVVLEIYSDFLCPFSQRFAPLADELLKKYPEKLAVVFHHFPLPMHAGAPQMHEASVCAQEQGKFWEFHDKLMARPAQALDAAGLSQLAAELGLDVRSFDACLQSGRYKAWVEREIERGRKAGATGTPSYSFNGRMSSGMTMLDVLSKNVDWYLAPSGPYPGRQAPPPGAGAPRPEVDLNKIHEFPAAWLEAGPSRGPKDAPITMIEFNDFHCPFCQKGARTVDELLAGRQDVRFISKQLPLPMHPNAKKASEAMVCAADQGRYWEMRREMFSGSAGTQSIEELKAVAAKAGLDAGKFAACLESGKAVARVEEDMRIANERGATGTPAYFINGRVYMGAMPKESFEQALEEAKTKK